MAGKKGQKKQVCSDEEQWSICAQVRVFVVSVAQVARRYAMNTNLIYIQVASRSLFGIRGAGCGFARAQGRNVSSNRGCGHGPRPNGPHFTYPFDRFVTVQRVDITLSDGRRISVEGTRPRCRRSWR